MIQLSIQPKPRKHPKVCVSDPHPPLLIILSNSLGILMVSISLKAKFEAIAYL